MFSLLQSKGFHIFVLILTAISVSQPTVTALTGILPQTWIHLLTMVVSVCGAILLYLSQSPFAKAFRVQTVAQAMNEKARQILAQKRETP